MTEFNQSDMASYQSDEARRLSDLEQRLAAINDTLWEIERQIDYWAPRFFMIAKDCSL